MNLKKTMLYALALILAATIGDRFGLHFGALALAVMLLGIRGSAQWETGSDGKSRHPHEHILYRKFGRWTKVVRYGPLALLAVVAAAARFTGDEVLIRLSLYLLWGGYLCWLFASKKHRGNELGES